MPMKQNKQLNYKKLIALLLVLTGLFLLFSARVSAKECYTVYGMYGDKRSVRTEI